MRYVKDVARSFRWYQELLALPLRAPAHEYFGQIGDDDGEVLLCLHSWGEHELPALASPDRAEPENGLLLFFRVEGYDASLARNLVDQLDEEPNFNHATGTLERRYSIGAKSTSASVSVTVTTRVA